MSFFRYFLDKVKRNKDILSLTVSFVTLMQVAIFACLNEDSQTLISLYYLKVFILCTVIFSAVFLSLVFYLHFDLISDSKQSLTNTALLTCVKRASLQLDREAYKRKMQVFSFLDILNIERSIKKDDQIWVLTTDVTLETSLIALSEVMNYNLEKGVKYTYFIPDTEATEASILELNHDYGKYKNFRLKKIVPDYKLLFEKFDVIIYSPEKNGVNGRLGFICVHFSDKPDEIIFRRFSEEDTKNLIGKLRRVREVTNA